MRRLDRYHALKRKRRRRRRRKRDKYVTKKWGIKAHNACGRKQAYESKQQADLFALRTSLYTGYPLWTYQCPYCGLWHLTSKDPSTKPASSQADA